MSLEFCFLVLLKWNVTSSSILTRHISHYDNFEHHFLIYLVLICEFWKNHSSYFQKIYIQGLGSNLWGNVLADILKETSYMSCNRKWSFENNEVEIMSSEKIIIPFVWCCIYFEFLSVQLIWELGGKPQIDFTHLQMRKLHLKVLWDECLHKQDYFHFFLPFWYLCKQSTSWKFTSSRRAKMVEG